MNAKRAVFIFVLLSLLFMVACTNHDALAPTVTAPSTKACTLACEDEAGLQEKIQEYFGYAPNSYTLKCSSCNVSRGGYVSADIIKNGEPVQLYYRWGSCSSGGTDCGWEMTFTSPSGSDLYAPIAAKYCTMIIQRTYVDTLNCSTLAYNGTSAVKSACFLGEYTTEMNGKRTLGLKQITERCDSSVEYLDT